MSNSIAAILSIGILGGLGLVFLVISILIRMNDQSRVTKCTEMVEGKIVKHSFPGDSRVKPVVEYVVNDRKYRTIKKYAGFKKVRYPLPVQSDIWENEKGYLCVKIAPAVNVRKMANEMWPIGSTAKVFYAAGNPKINYVDRPIYNSFLVNMFMLAGIFLICLGCVMFIIIR